MPRTPLDETVDDLETVVYGDESYDPIKILAIFEEALDLYPRSIRLYNCFGDFLLDYDMYQRALAIQRLADQVGPRNIEHLLQYGFNLAMTFEDTGDSKYYEELFGVVDRLWQREPRMDDYDKREFQLLRERMQHNKEYHEHLRAA